VTFDEYQRVAATTAVYPKDIAIPYCCLGLAEEAGEVCGKVKKHYRDGAPLAAAFPELGDVLWYLSQLCAELGTTLGEVAEANLEKLASRKQRDRLHGSGDSR
jgi:NTP pyrophosphatase (non-canonical NTP hydrolase)